jgi:16S rRNA (uracil1498-N3)-methyltransferase
MHSFFCEDINQSIITLNEEESTHATRVLRLQSDDIVVLLDGKGSRADARIIEPHHKKCQLQIVGEIFHEPRILHGLHIAMAPTKNIDRFEWFLEKATEIGIKRITPILSANSERKVVNHERLQKILLSAMKQSQRLYLPQLDELTPYKKLIDELNANSINMIAHCEESQKLLFAEKVEKTKDVTILIGPEGDFNSTEIEQALQKGCMPVSLGQARLRTETAGVYAVSVYNS